MNRHEAIIAIPAIFAVAWLASWVGWMLFVVHGLEMNNLGGALLILLGIALPAGVVAFLVTAAVCWLVDKWNELS